MIIVVIHYALLRRPPNSAPECEATLIGSDVLAGEVLVANELAPKDFLRIGSEVDVQIPAIITLFVFR